MKSLEYYIKNHKLESFINNSLYNEALCNFFDKDEIKTFESMNYSHTKDVTVSCSAANSLQNSLKDIL